MTRDDWVRGQALLLAFRQDRLAIPRALRARQWADLAAAREIVERDVDPRLALTDPALYRSLREAITEFHLIGWTALDADALRAHATIHQAAS